MSSLNQMIDVMIGSLEPGDGFTLRQMQRWTAGERGLVQDRLKHHVKAGLLKADTALGVECYFTKGEWRDLDGDR